MAAVVVLMLHGPKAAVMVTDPVSVVSPSQLLHPKLTTFVFAKRAVAAVSLVSLTLFIEAAASAWLTYDTAPTNVTPATAIVRSPVSPVGLDVAMLRVILVDVAATAVAEGVMTSVHALEDGTVL
jgi:hypothetical protein